MIRLHRQKLDGSGASYYLCTRECVSKWCFNVKLFLHSLHWYGRSVECNSKCVFRQCLWANDLPQWTQTCGRSPVCTRACVVRWCLSKNDLPHSSHAYGRSLGVPPVARSCSSAVRISSFGFISRTVSLFFVGEAETKRQMCYMWKETKRRKKIWLIECSLWLSLIDHTDFQ